VKEGRSSGRPSSQLGDAKYRGPVAPCSGYTGRDMQQQVPWLVGGRYEVGEVVGRGGYGMVCRGLDRQTGQRVALKMLSPEAGRDADVVERMLREQQALVALSGTCAVTAVDLCRLESGAPCLVMEWLEGCDLEQQLSAWEATGKRGSLELLVAVLGPLTQTLERAHGIGIVHRDVKPANIFLTPAMAPGVRLLDFGLSRMKSAAPLTEVGMVMGSPSYIAPETWRGNSAAVDGRADLFALAVIVFRWLTGELPFDAPDLIGKMMAVTGAPRPSLKPLRADLPASVDAWMSRALAVEPLDRFQTGAELFRAFEAALRGERWPRATADTSGVRSAAGAANSGTPSDTSERKSALAFAWGAAASLLKRFTGTRRRETPSEAPPAELAPMPAPASPTTHAAPNEEQSAGDRNTIWLDSSELEDAEPKSARPAEPAPKATAETSPEPESQPSAKTASDAEKAPPRTKSKSKTRARRKNKSLARTASKTKTKSKPKRRQPKARSR